MVGDVRFSDGIGHIVTPLTVTASNRFAAQLLGAKPRLGAYARTLSRNRDDAEDLVQETLTKAWRARDRFTVGTNFLAWIFTILRNTWRSEWRRTRGEVPLDQAQAQHVATAETQSAQIDYADVTKLLRRLPAEQRAALLLIGVDCLSYDEAARRANISIGALKSRVFRGRAALRALLDQRTQTGALAPA